MQTHTLFQAVIRIHLLERRRFAQLQDFLARVLNSLSYDSAFMALHE